jgi:BirA family biotin operon repressor/biotin-[acetyl-CoA-carboxylase] ligase
LGRSEAPLCLFRGPGFSPEELHLALKGRLGREAVFVRETASTNDLAMGFASEGAPEGTVVAADSQTKGRGRLGRRWASPPGCNVHMSVVLRPALPPRDAPVLTVLSAVSVAEALRDVAGVEAAVKWPNDVLVHGRKIAGILLETRSDTDRVLFAVLGIGINVNVRIDGLPEEVRKSATSLSALTGREHSRAEVMAAVLDRLSCRLDELGEKGRGALLDRWRELSSTLGREVRVAEGGISFTGKAMDIDEDGRLIVRLEHGGTRKVASGDVESLRVRRPPGDG